MHSSSGLLLLNVEDILGYAQLKAGKFQKNIKPFNLRRAVEEIVSIQQYQADSKGIAIRTSFIGFPVNDNSDKILKSMDTKTCYRTKNELMMTNSQTDIISFEGSNTTIHCDEKRIKQILMNL